MRQRGRRGELSGLNVVDISEIARRRSQPGRRANLARHRRGHAQRLVFESNLSTPERLLHSRARGGGGERKAPSVSRDSQGTSATRLRVATGTIRGAETSLLSFRQDWRGSEDQALQPVRQQAQLCVRADLVEPVDDVLDNPAIRPGRYHQLLCCVVVRRRFAMYRRFFFSWHLHSLSMGPRHGDHFA